MVGGKFRLERVVGRGAMGSVWTATHVNLGHRIAIKLVARDFVKSPEALRRFDAEAKAAARLQSRHVVQVFDNGTLDDGTPYIAMELLAGENLDERIQRTGPIPLDEAVQILAQCCKALARAHAAGIVHRDIKPENVFLAREPDGEAEVVKLLDFGVAKIAMAIEGWTSSTGTGAMLGTPIYMSPEQVRASRDVDRRTDLYSLGLVAFTMLTGKLVIEADTFGEVLLKISTQPLPSLRALAPSLPPAVEAWFFRACARDAGERHQSAQEFIDALRAAAGERVSDVRATPSPTPRPTPPTLHSFGAPSVALLFAQTASSVSVTGAGLPRVRPGVALAAVLSGAVITLGGLVWFVGSQHGWGSSSVGGTPHETVVGEPVAVAPLPAAAPAPSPVAVEEAGAPTSSEPPGGGVTPRRGPTSAPVPAAILHKPAPPPTAAPAARVATTHPPHNPSPKPTVNLGY
jgi:eukaryotic-like serine/threonine-protein kinase